jgi:subtilase family serine protease
MGNELRALAALRRPLLPIAAAAAAGLGVVMVPVAPSLAAVQPATMRVGAAPVIPDHAVFLGRTPESRPLHFDVVLSPRNPAILRALALGVATPGSGDFRKFLTVRQFAARFGRTAAEVNAADSSLRKAGLTPGAVSADGLVIPVAATVRTAAASLGTRFATYRLGTGRMAFANTAAPRLPRSVARVTAAVVGLSDVQTLTAQSSPQPSRALITARSRRPAAPAAGAAGGARPAWKAARPCQAAVHKAAASNGWTFPQLAAAYSISGLYARGHLGAGTRVALFELDAWSPRDVAQFQRCYGTHVPVKAVGIDGGAGSGPGSGEAALDIDTIIGLAPQSSITVYDAPPSGGLKASVDEYTRIVDDDTAQVLSISYGICELGLPRSVANAENTLFEQAAAEGMSVFAASGDEGSEGCYARKRPSRTELSAEDPASQPFVTGVGGTTLSAIRPWPAERVWNNGTRSGSGAGGGGISRLWTMPAWQYGPGTHNSLSSRQPCGARHGYCREVPDVSASADPRHPYVIRWAGKWQGIGGTSAATPLWAAMLADIDSSNWPANRAGFLNPVLYAAARQGSGDFHDITRGNNDYTGSHHGTYPATAHYDMASGLGTPIATGLAATLARAGSLISYTAGPGSAAPPATLGSFPVKAFSPDTCTNGRMATSVPGPGGVVGFSPLTQCELVGDGWQAWANGYAGDVYWADSRQGPHSSLTLTLPADAKAFYFYLAPQQPGGSFQVRATAPDGTVSGPYTVTGQSGAQYVGFYAGSYGADIKCVTITGSDFAVGEFGLAVR